MNEERQDTCLHEASHAAMAIWFRRPVEYVWRASGLTVAGEQVGHCQAPIRDQVEATQLPVILAGYWSENRANWPPPFEQAKVEKLEALGLVLKLLGLGEEQYDRIVAITAEILDHPEWRRLRDAIARALAYVPRLEAEDLAALCEAHNIPPPREEPAPC